jgi:hypothetical protein
MINLMFELNDEQMKQYLDWCDTELKDTGRDIIGSREAFVFIPHSKGVAVKVVYDDKELDLTQYETVKNENTTKEEPSLILDDNLINDIKHVCGWYQGRELERYQNVRAWINEVEKRKKS